MNTEAFIRAALAEDAGDGDHSTRACISPEARGQAVILAKEEGVLAGISLAQQIFLQLDPEATFRIFRKDGESAGYGDTVMEISAGIHTILTAERLVLNCMQRMSGIATLTRRFVDKISAYPARILDTRKTTPLFRAHEKAAVLIGGGHNHRMGLYDMIMLKDNHIDFCGGIEKAISKTHAYLKQTGLELAIEVETRSIDDVRKVLAKGGIQRIMLDNFTPEMLREAVSLIGGAYETEASGGINLDNIVAYAQTGVDFISVGAIIHHAVSLDLSLKAQIL